MKQEIIKLTTKTELQEKAKNIPHSYFKKFGCYHCEWKHDNRCPYYDEKTFNYQQPENAICEKRMFYIMSLVPVYNSIPTRAQFDLDFGKSLATVRMMRDKDHMEQLEKQIESESDPIEVGKLTKQLNRHRTFWQSLWKEIARFDDNQVHRDTVKKVDITTNKIVRPSDVAKMINSNRTIDVEVIEDEKNKN